MAVVKVKPESIETLRPVLEKLIEETRKEEGNLKYDWYQDAKEPGTFIAIETFKNQEAFQAHLSSQYFIQGIEKMKDFYTAPVEIRILKAENVAKKWFEVKRFTLLNY